MVNVSQVTHRGLCARIVDTAVAGSPEGPKSGRAGRHGNHDELART
jgi:hypothetical protein